jgi:hypothetical protein
MHGQIIFVQNNGKFIVAGCDGLKVRINQVRVSSQTKDAAKDSIFITLPGEK